MYSSLLCRPPIAGLFCGVVGVDDVALLDDTKGRPLPALKPLVPSGPCECYSTEHTCADFVVVLFS
jgi:hypothetical protein